MKILSAVLFLFFAVSGIFAQNDKPVVVLKGFDPVTLVEGRQVKGSENISTVRGRFKYLFANQAGKQKFEKNPELYEAQNNGECTFMRGGVPGDPDLWEVYQSKIYLFGTSLCRTRFDLSPETILHPEKREKIKLRNVAIVLFDGAELLDFAGPGEVFASAQTVDGQNAFNVYTVAATTAPIVSQGFVTIKPQYSFADAPPADIIVFPGGNVANFLSNKESMNWAKAASGKAEIAISVCTGAFILADSELLENKNATTHWGSISRLKRKVPSATILENVRFVDNGQIVTTAGVSAGIDGSLHVVERLLGAQSAKLTAGIMEYSWQPTQKSGASRKGFDRVFEKFDRYGIRQQSVGKKMTYKIKIFAIFTFSVAVFAFACANNEPSKTSNNLTTNSAATDIQTYKSVGVIKKIDRETGKLIVDHEDIPGYMSAMEMDESVKDKAMLETVKVGDRVEFEIERTGSKIVFTKLLKIGEVALLTGAEIYKTNCAECHGATGEGAKKGIPLISGHALDHSESEFLGQVTNGEGKKMPAFKDKLSAEEVACNLEL